MNSFNSYRSRSLLLRLDDDSSHHHSVNSSWLDRLASPVVILVATIAASIAIGVIMWFVPSPRLERISDTSELAHDVQQSKLVFAGFFALLYSTVYPLYDQIVDTVWLYQSSKTSASASTVDDLNKSNGTFIESTFLLERWILVISVLINSLAVLIYMDPTRNPETLVYFGDVFGNIQPSLANGCLLSIIRQSSKFLTREITIFIWIAKVATQFVFLYSNSTPLRASMVVINLLTLLYPIVNALKEHYNAESRFPSDEIDNNKTKFENHSIAAYYFCLILPLANMVLNISPAVKVKDNDEFLRKMGVNLLVYGLFFPLLLLLFNPKRLYYGWQDEKIKFLYKHSTQLLEGLLPGKVIAHFRHSTEPFVEKFDCVTIIFVDIMDYTVVCRPLTPFQIVLLLDVIFRQFDKAADFRGVYRIETVGDCYMASTGCPDAEDPCRAAGRMVLFAQDLIQIVRDFQPPFDLGSPLQVRIGVHSGPVTAGTLSGKMLRYCLFGNTVNTASRMESTGEVGRIHLSEDTVSLVSKDATCSYMFESRLPMHVKGKGVMSTYFLDAPEKMMSSLDVPFGGSRSGSEPDEPEPSFLFKNLSTSLLSSFMGRNENANSNSNPNSRKSFVAPMTSDSVKDERRMLVVPCNEDPEFGTKEENKAKEEAEEKDKKEAVEAEKKAESLTRNCLIYMFQCGDWDTEKPTLSSTGTKEDLCSDDGVEEALLYNNGQGGHGGSKCSCMYVTEEELGELLEGKVHPRDLKNYAKDSRELRYDGLTETITPLMN